VNGSPCTATCTTPQLPNVNNEDPFLAPTPEYHHLPAHLAQQLAALPPLPQQGRGISRGRGRGGSEHLFSLILILYVEPSLL
jgi:hypothetical protein